MSSFDFLDDDLRALRSAGRHRRLVPRKLRGVRIVDEDGTERINFGGNDYLGLATERESRETSTGSTASALVCGWSPSHQVLSEKIAELESSEAAAVFPSGFAACSGTVATLAREGDLILSDELNHASLIDGCRLSRAKRVVYPHRCCEQVESTLRATQGQYSRVWIVTDGVFSMDGHVAPLPQLCDLADRYDAFLIVDEAHATGVLGESGSGLCEAMGVKPRVPIRIGTLSKAIGSQGGFVVGPATVVDYLINCCRSLIFSTALAPAAVTSALDSLERIATEPERRQRVTGLSRRLRAKLRLDSDPSGGSGLGGGSTSANEIESGIPIVPVPMGDAERAVSASSELAQDGFFVPAIRPPTVPEGGSRLRISISAAHSEEMIDALAERVARLCGR